MDLRSMLNADMPKPPAPKSTSPRQESDLKLNPPPQPYNYSARRETYPQPPPPPQTLSPSNRDPTSPNGVAQQHYSPWPPSGPFPFASPHPPKQPPDPGHAPHGYLDRAATMPQTNGQQHFHQQSPSVITPQSASSANSFPHPQYRPSSVHSLTPTSAHSSGPTFHRDSSSAGIGHSPVQTQHPAYHPQRYASYTEGAAGHPPAFDARGSVVAREGSVPRLQEPLVHHSDPHYPAQQTPKPPQPPDTAPPPLAAPTAHPPTQNLNTNPEYLSAIDRDRSESVSPKSFPPSQRKDGAQAVPPPPSSAHSSERPTSSENKEQRNLQSYQSNNLPPSIPAKAHSRSPEMETRPETAPEPAPPTQAKSDGMDLDLKNSQLLNEDHQPQTMTPRPSPKPKPKRDKPREMPIWAHKAHGGRNVRILKPEHGNRNGVGAAARRRSPAARTSPVPRTPPRREDESKGGWEKSILNLEPQEELTKTVADFLFCHVVSRPPESAATATIEIEAKLGHLIDKNRGERLRLPVMTECIVSKEDPSLRLAFQSSMTEDQHRQLNNFLNDAVTKSHPRKSIAQSAPLTAPSPPPPKPRVKVTYVHTRETDSFHELTPAAENALPASVRSALMNQTATRSGSKPSVRLSVDQKTGAELARIVKVRLADLDVHCPQAPFDWRLSVNLEATVPAAAAGDAGGELADSVDPQTGRKRLRRSKDRLTYRHQAYQIDLTQVTIGEPLPGHAKPEKEHELEIECDAAALREAGAWAAEGQAGRFQDMVRGFVDNVRLLVRHCPRG